MPLSTFSSVLATVLLITILSVDSFHIIPKESQDGQDQHSEESVLQQLESTNGEQNIVDPACGISNRIQQITFHDQPTFNGKSVTFCSNQPDLQNSPSFNTIIAKYFCVNRGVWIIGVDVNGFSSNGWLFSGNIGPICFLTESFELKFTSIRHLASSNLDESALSLYNSSSSTASGYRGLELYLGGAELRLLEPISTINSYAITGTESFTIFSGTNFDGETECLVPEANNPFLKGLGFHDEIGLRSIGSIRKGCDSSKDMKMNEQRTLAQTVTIDAPEITQSSILNAQI